MQFTKVSLALLALLPVSGAFVASPSFSTRGVTSLESTALSSDDNMAMEIRKTLKYKAGGADTEFSRRFGHLAGKQIKTVGQTFAEFTKELGFTVNALYKNMVTDIVGTTHLIVVNARFERDAAWSLGIISALDLLLKNYPEKEVADKIVSSLFKAVGMDEAEIRKEAADLQAWCEGKTAADVEAALAGESEGPLSSIAQKIKGDEYWMYSRYFGIGLLKVMETVGVEMDKDAVYPVMESWMSTKLGRSHLTACADSDLYFKIRGKLEMMETMMKEIEIREKKRMAERLEEKAEAALRAADREEKLKAEIEAEAAKSREVVGA